MTSLGRKTVSGVILNALKMFASRGVGILTTILLGWFLSPVDFGLVAMMALFLSIANTLADSNLQQALVRMPKVAELELNTAFVANLVFSLLAYVCLFAIAPLIADFYDRAILVELIRVSGLNVFFVALQLVPSAVLTKRMDFKSQLMASVPAAIVSAFTAILLAYLGAGVWALVIQTLVNSCVRTLLLWRYCVWSPTTDVSWSVFRSMYSFSHKLFLARQIDLGFKNLYVLVIAKYFGAGLAGLYYFADRVRELAVYQVVSSIQQVTYPALSQMQDDRVRMKQNYRKLTILTTYFLFPTILFLAAFAPLLFSTVLPEKWLDSAHYLQIMCIASLLIPIHSINLNVLKVFGRSDLFLKLELLKKSLALAIFLVGFQYGIYGILVGQVVSSIVAYFPNSYYTNQLLGYSVKEQIADILPNLFLASGVIGSLYYLHYAISFDGLGGLLLLGVLATTLYFASSAVFRFPAVGWSIEMIRLSVPRWKVL